MNDPDLNEFENDGGVNGFSDLLFSNCKSFYLIIIFYKSRICFAFFY